MGTIQMSSIIRTEARPRSGAGTSSALGTAYESAAAVSTVYPMSAIDWTVTKLSGFEPGSIHPVMSSPPNTVSRQCAFTVPEPPVSSTGTFAPA